MFCKLYSMCVFRVCTEALAWTHTLESVETLWNLEVACFNPLAHLWGFKWKASIHLNEAPSTHSHIQTDRDTDTLTQSGVIPWQAQTQPITSLLHRSGDHSLIKTGRWLQYLRYQVKMAIIMWKKTTHAHTHTPTCIINIVSASLWELDCSLSSSEAGCDCGRNDRGVINRLTQTSCSVPKRLITAVSLTLSDCFTKCPALQTCISSIMNRHGLPDFTASNSIILYVSFWVSWLSVSLQ